MRSEPNDPIIASLVRAAKSRQVSRRQLFTGLGVGAAALGATSLTGCADASGKEGQIRWASWTYYLDFDEDTQDYPTLNAFIEKTGIDVQYFEDVDDNKTFIGKIKDQLKLKQDTGYDLFTLTDSSLVRIFEQDQLLQFDRALMPHVEAEMIDIFKHATFDPNREWAIPFQGGMTGLCYNAQLYPKGVKTVSDLWAADLKGKVSLLSEQDDTLGLIMLEQGVDIAGEWGDDEFNAALAVVEEQIARGQVFNVKGNSYTQDLQNGSVLAAMCWSGDIAMLNEEAGEEIWKFVVPESGSPLFIDSFCMPETAVPVDDIHKLVDYYYEPEVAAQVAEYVQYVTPVKGARDAMAKLNPEMADNPLIFPDEEMSKRIYDMRSLSSQEDNKFAQAYQKVLGN